MSATVTPLRRAPNVAAAVGFGGRPPPRRLRLVSFRVICRGKLVGLANIELPIGLKINGCPVFKGRNGPFATLPQRPVLDAAGRHVKADGQGQFEAMGSWRERRVADAFSTRLVELVRERHPELFEAVQPELPVS